ncbi:GMC family oxidoreductase [Aspergillus neoniger CBS 115656]|uniref:Aryl-alcohol dehydrogenase n=1 Tax=Aspergillus neoniger (strain CBS 115656) TaxID=1448310 RepID=A0A318YLW5_ASPNB|nr:aryl-alcohol dehydrogenase [Aspergillus neoniger CBS 115656]PYH35194.1 aryl-alcohol dehydrogenase [Aspergillus neoniger CBS 115656]
MMERDTSSLSDIPPVYDYVVVGGGTSGLVVASRLTEDPAVSVLVLEAGSDGVDDPRIAAPGLSASTYFDPEFDWSLISEPQESLNGRRLAQSRGRTLGGSSAINMGMAIYPSRSDIDSWEQLGNSGWNWKSLSTYMRKSQTFIPPSDEIRDQLSLDYVDLDVQGTDGPIQISFGNGPYPAFTAAWPRTFEALNHRLTGDPMSGLAKGAFCNPATIHGTSRARSHAGVAYYTPEIAQRSNLRVITEAFVEKVLLDKTACVDDGQAIATGIQFRGIDGIQRTVAARAEVILAAGTIKTPHLLELSGIGDAKLLQAHGIDIIIDNPNVGENLQEHGLPLRDPEVAKAAMEAWQSSGAGPLGSHPLGSAFMTHPELETGELSGLIEKHLKEEGSARQTAQYRVLRRFLEDDDEPTCQYTLAPFQMTPDKGSDPRGTFSMSEPGNYVSIVAVLNWPFSRGSVHLASSDPTVLPTFDPRMLSHPLDLEIQARHVMWLETLAATEPMASLLKPNGRRLHYPTRVTSLETARELTRDRIICHYHVSGTAAMMPQEIGGVVDDRLRVVMPLIPRGNIQTTVYAVAEKAVDIIKEDRLASS